MVKRILQYFRRETVLSAALICALLSFLLTPPSVIHLQGIDTTTLLMLFSLMTIVAGFRRMGALDAVSRKLTRRVTTLRGLSAVMVALCFALSMLVTNDVALLTLVPLTLLLFRAGGQKSTIWTVVLETVAANLGSMVTPIGNPQNLYLYTSGRLTALDFLTLLTPYAAVALALLLALCLLLPKERVAVDTSARAPLAGKMLTHWRCWRLRRCCPRGRWRRRCSLARWRWTEGQSGRWITRCWRRSCASLSLWHR